MRTRHPSLRNQVLVFTEPGRQQSNGQPVVGIDGLASPAWLTSDGHIVLHSSAVIGGGLRRRRIAKLTDADLDASVTRFTGAPTPPGADAFAHLLIIADSQHTIDAIVAKLPSAEDIDVARLPSPSAEDINGVASDHGVWIASTDLETLSRNRTRTRARLVYWSSTSSPDGGLERQVATMHDMGIDVLALPHKEWSAGSIALCHRFGILAYAWGCEYEREMATVIDSGIDAVQTAFPHRLVAVVRQYR